MSGRRGHVVIAGAGIGGLTAGCALRRSGFEVTVLERAPVLAAVGAGITVQANAMQALGRLGLDAAVSAAGLAMDRSEIRRADGRVLASTSLGALAKTLGARSVAIHRARLQQVLLDALGANAVRTGAEVVGFEATDAGVAVTLAGGEVVRGDALVGADGLRSVVRAGLHGPAEPVYAGYTTWRGVTRGGASELGVRDGEAAEMWGRGRRFGYVGIGHGEVYWFAVADAPAGGRDEAGRVPAALAERFGDFAAPAPELLARVVEADVVRTDVYDRPPLDAWGRGLVTLLGDAAHPMTPNLGQGGCQAIEDALVLGESLATASDLAAGLRAYEAKRAPRARWFVEQSRSAGRVAQASGRFACALRDTALRLLPARVLERQLVAAQTLPH